MNNIEIRLAYDELDNVQKLLQEYSCNSKVDFSFQNFENELNNLSNKYAMPLGRIYTIYFNNKLAGCLAFHPINHTACEFKRLYIKPDFRKKKLAQLLLEKAIQDARNIGYLYIYLDTMNYLEDAIHLYEKFGFNETTAYHNNHIPNIKYYKLIL